MSNRTIQTNQLAPNTSFMVRGHVTFSRVSRHIEGEALQKDIEQKTRLGRKNIITKPYTTITICDAQVVFKDAAAVSDPSKRYIEEAYALEAMFTSSTAKNTGMCFTGVNKTKRLPWAATKNADGTVVQMAALEGELAAGLDVTLVLRVFADNRNNGVSLDGIILNEPVRYFTSVDLSAYGLTFVPNTDAATTPEGADEHADQGQPIVPPTGDPYSSQPVQPVPGAPQVPPPSGYMPQQAAPGSAVPAGYPQAPGTAVPPAPAPGPYGQGATPDGGGIRYNPGTDPARQY